MPVLVPKGSVRFKEMIFWFSMSFYIQKLAPFFTVDMLQNKWRLIVVCSPWGCLQLDALPKPQSKFLLYPELIRSQTNILGLFRFRLNVASMNLRIKLEFIFDFGAQMLMLMLRGGVYPVGFSTNNLEQLSFFVWFFVSCHNTSNQ